MHYPIWYPPDYGQYQLAQNRIQSNSKTPMTDTAVTLLSGGIDSATCLGVACNTHDRIIPVHYQYGQQTAEVERRMAEAQRTHMVDEYPEVTIEPLRVVDYEPVFKHNAGGVAESGKEFGHINEVDGRSSGYVPMRNLHLIATGAAFADTAGATAVYHGAQAGDHADYPDCRPTFMQAAHNAIDRAVPDGQTLKLNTPLLNLSKPDVLERAEEVGVAFKHTYSCYANTPVEDPQPCGDCPACLERAEAFGKSSVEDPFHTKQVVADD